MSKFGLVLSAVVCARLAFCLANVAVDREGL